MKEGEGERKRKIFVSRKKKSEEGGRGVKEGEGEMKEEMGSVA